MTSPSDAAVEDSHAVPLGLRVAATLCVVVGVLSVAGALALGVPQLGTTPGASLVLSVNLLASVAVCAAAVFAWRRRKLAVALLIAGWALPTALSVALGHAAKLPSLFMVLALIALGGNWHELR